MRWWTCSSELFTTKILQKQNGDPDEKNLFTCRFNPIALGVISGRSCSSKHSEHNQSYLESDVV